MKDPVVIIGSGGHAKIVIDILQRMDIHRIVGVITKDTGSSFLGYPILGDDDIIPTLISNGINKLAMGVGGFRNNNLRKSIFIRLKSLGFDFITAIHPSVVIANTASIGEGSILFAGVIVNPEVIIGDNVIIATSASIDHETRIESHVLISAGVTIGANSTVKEGALLALGSKIISGVTVSNDILIGAGAVVVNDCFKQGTYLGIPAKLKMTKTE